MAVVTGMATATDIPAVIDEESPELNIELLNGFKIFFFCLH